MAQPTWVTETGSLGTIPEGKFYRATLEAFDPDYPSDATKVKFIKISGDLPEGVVIRPNGTIEGTPKTYVVGVPDSVSQNKTSKFSVRSYTETIVNGNLVVDNLNDRTFSITVTGQDVPYFVTAAGSLGSYHEGALINKQIVYRDDDPDDTVEISVVTGSLPPGITLSETGLLYGYIEPTESITEPDDGFENTGFDSQPYQFTTGTISKTFQFTLKITDGKNSSLRTFSIFVGTATVDTTVFTADTTILTADVVSSAPYIKDYVENIGTYRHENYFIYDFNGIDHEGDTLNYSYTGTLPAGLTIDSETGFMYGDITSIGVNETEYNFTLTVYKKEAPEYANTYDYKITILGDIDNTVTWDTDANLGTINNGEISILSVSVSSTNDEIKYRLKSGEANKLPQGLSLTSSGNIIGRVAYNMFRLTDYKETVDSTLYTSDSTLLTADENGSDYITFDNGTTTFDSEYKFTVQAYTDDATINTSKEFTLSVNNSTNIPLTNIYIKALLDETDRSTIDELTQNSDIFKDELLYRSDDPYFGINDEIIYTHLYGLSPENITTYVESLTKHYDKQVTLGDFKTARALDSNDNLLYEVIYCDIIDDISDVNNSVETSVGTVYPNSLMNLREDVVDKVGQISNTLPRWMTSKQSDGKILGFIPSWVVAYVLPNKSTEIVYDLQQSYTKKLNKINFEIDRYVLDLQTSRGYDTNEQKWYEHCVTTFDIYTHETSADITSITSDSTTYTADEENTTSTKTTFDDDKTRFIEIKPFTVDLTTLSCDDISITVDGGYKDYKIYTKTDKFDEYLLFPKTDIINSK